MASLTIIFVPARDWGHGAKFRLPVSCGGSGSCTADSRGPAASLIYFWWPRFGCAEILPSAFRGVSSKLRTALCQTFCRKFLAAARSPVECRAGPNMPSHLVILSSRPPSCMRVAVTFEPQAETHIQPNIGRSPQGVRRRRWRQPWPETSKSPDPREEHGAGRWRGVIPHTPE